MSKAALACAVLLAAASVAAPRVGLPGPRNEARAQETQSPGAAAGPVRVEGLLGAATNARLLGSAPQGPTGDPAEAWALPISQPPYAPVIDGRPLGGSILLMRHTTAEGWRYVESVANAGGEGDYPGAGPASERSGRVTPRGGLVLVVPAAGGPRGATLVVRHRGGRPTIVAPPGPEILPDPEEPGLEREYLSPTALAAVDGPQDRTSALVAVEGRLRQRAVARFADGTWSREPICAADAAGAIPEPCTAEETLQGSAALLKVEALSASESGAWLLARADPGAGRGLVLFQRETSGDAPRWRLRDIGLPLFERGDPARGVTEVRPSESHSALTATPDGVWVDGTFRAQGVETDLTVFFNGRTGADRRATTWCDGAGLCDHPFGVRFGNGYRSFAWEAGRRVITNVRRLDERRSLQGPSDYATLEGTAFVRRPAWEPGGLVGAAFGAPDEGWVRSSHITRGGSGSVTAPWPIPVRRPLTSVAAGPGAPPGEIGSPALTVGLGGTVLRYSPGQGWDAEPLLGSSGVSQDDLRGVAWPSEEFAFAVGDEGAMWRWRRTTGLWEADPGAPLDFQGNLMGVTFQPGDPERGYAVGRQGVLLRYDKSWTPEALPPELATAGPAGGPADLMAVAFAGSQALIAAGGSLLVNDGGGWRVDTDAQALIGRVYAVAGLPDGGAVAGGRGSVIVRDAGPGTPWRLNRQPAVSGDQTVTAVAAVRDGGQVRALIAVDPDEWPFTADVTFAVVDPDLPPPRPVALASSSFGTLLRETDAGWRDEERTFFQTPSADNARKSDPVAGFLLEASGRGWVVGGWNGLRDGLENGRGGSSAGIDEPVSREASTASVARYAPGGGAEGPPARRAASVATPPGPVRLLVGGHAQCEAACAQGAQLDLMPDRTLSRAVAQAGELRAQAGGPRALLYTGGRAPDDGRAAPAELARLAELLGGGAATAPVFGAVAPADSAGADAQGFRSAFAGFPAPFGGGAAAQDTAPVDLGVPAASGSARTHYAVDLRSGEATVRLVVIDNAPGSLAAADGYQNPAEPQRPWLERVLADARSKGVPVVVMGARSLNGREPEPSDRARAATDGTEIATLLRDGGASAYVYDSPERQVEGRVPSGAADAIPSFGSGTLGYRSSRDVFEFGVPALTMLEVDAAKRDAGTNRAPVSARLLPVIEDLALEAVDGRVLNRSQPALFRGLGRRPRSGDRWSLSVLGSSPYVQLPGPSCAGGCAGRLDPEVRFVSSDPDIADFVRQDPTSRNPRKPFVDPKTDKPVADASSGLLCSFNAGTTTVSVQSAGIAYSTTVTIRNGSVLRPCGTVPLRPERFPRPAASPAVAVPLAPQAGGGSQPNPSVEIPVPPPAPATPGPATAPTPAPNPSPLVPSSVLSPPVAVGFQPPSASPRPIPPSGTSPVSSTSTVLQPAARVEKEREEELAPEQQQSAVRYDPGGTRLVGGAVIGLVLCAALAGAALRPHPRGRDRGEQLALSYDRVRSRDPWRSE